MKNEKEFRDSLIKHKVNPVTIEFTVETVKHFLKSKAQSMISLKRFCKKHISSSPKAMDYIIALIRYFSFIKDNEKMIYMITLSGTEGIIESQKDRLIHLKGEDLAEDIFKDISFPPLGTPYEKYPDVIRKYLKKLQNKMPIEDCQNMLAGNHHHVSESHFENERKKLEACGDFDQYLREKHQTLVETLQFHCDYKKLWFEQIITQEVVDMVKNNQEIQTGIRRGNQLFVQKIPYKPDAWLKEKDPVQKRYLACHCPFVRSSILKPREKVSSLWCYCTGGFIKVSMEVMFQQEVKIHLLESLLDGHDRCYFCIDLPKEALKYIKES